MNFYPVIYPVIWLNLFFIGFLCMYICVCIHMCVCMWVKSLYFEIYKTMLPTNDNNLISAFLFEILCLVPLMVLWIFFFWTLDERIKETWVLCLCPVDLARPVSMTGNCLRGVEALGSQLFCLGCGYQTLGRDVWGILCPLFQHCLT